MHITILSSEHLRLEGSEGPLTIDAASEDASYSPYHMVAGGLGACTFLVLSSWAHHAKLDASTLAIDVAWSFADGEHRVSRWTITLHWPTLPEPRRAAALRVAGKCGIHETLMHPGEMELHITE
ncbi:MAG TPA: OsmC family protein [Gemmatimonadaceae bacterium]|nr:OsmC family protein [Gemmatimonadaceae bacterium]